MTDSRAVAAAFVAAFNAGDLDQVAALLAPDATWTLPGDLPPSGVWRGREAILNEFLPAGMTLFAPGSPTFTVDHVVGEGEWTVVEATGRGSSATGEPFEASYVFVFGAAAGVLHTVREHVDSDRWRRALCPAAVSSLPAPTEGQRQ